MGSAQGVGSWIGPGAGLTQVQDPATGQLHWTILSALQGSPQIWRFGGRRVVAALIVIALGAIKATTALLLLNFHTYEVLDRPNDIGPQARG